MKKKILSIALTLCMLAALLPTMALGVSVEDGWTGVAGDTGTMEWRYITTDDYDSNVNNFNIHGTFGGYWKQVTYGNVGFYTYLSTDGGVAPANRNDATYVPVDGAAHSTAVSGVTLQVALTTVLGGGAVQITYTVANSGSSPATFSFGSCTDIQIGSDDSAKITALTGDRGFTMVSDEDNDKYNDDYARFNFFCKDVPGYVDDVSCYWFGKYSSAWSNLYNSYTTNTGNAGIKFDDADGASYTGDSGMAYAWTNQTLAAGASRDYKVLMGIGGADSVNITSKAGLDPYDETNPPSTFTITVNPSDPNKDYALMHEVNGQWSAALNAAPTFTGTYVPVIGETTAGVLTDKGDGWYQNSANTDQTITFHNVLAGEKYRVDERSSVTDKQSDASTYLPAQAASANTLTVDTTAEGKYALYSSTDGTTWTLTTHDVGVTDQSTNTVNGTDNWYQNSAVSDGKLTFSYTAADNTQYKVIEQTSYPVSGTSKNVIVSTAAGTEYSLWHNQGGTYTLVTANPTAEGTGAAMSTGSDSGWYMNAATANGAFIWSGLVTGDSYQVRSRIVNGSKTSTASLSVTAADGHEYALFQKADENWQLVTNVTPAGTGAAQTDDTHWWSAATGNTLTFSVLDSANTYKICQRTKAVDETPAGGASDAVAVRSLQVSVSSDTEYSLWSYDGSSWALSDIAADSPATVSTGSWYKKSDDAISWTGLSADLTYAVHSRATAVGATVSALSKIQIVAQTRSSFNYAVKDANVITAAAVIDDSNHSVDPTAANPGWYAGSNGKVYQWTFDATSDPGYTVLENGDYDAFSSLSVTVENGRSYAVYVENESGTYVSTGIAATGTGAAMKGGLGWYSAADGVTLTFSGLNPGKNYKIVATKISSVTSDMITPSTSDTDLVNGDNSRPVREEYTEGSGESAQKYARITVENTSTEYKYKLAKVVTDDSGNKTYQDVNNYQDGNVSGSIVYEQLDVNATFVVYSKFISTAVTFPRRSAELGPYVPGDYISTSQVPVASSLGETKIYAKLNNGTAELSITNEQITSVISESESTGIITLDMSAIVANSAVIPAKLVTAAVGASDGKGLEVKFHDAAVELDNTALGVVNGSDVTLSVNQVDSNGLNDEQKNVLGKQSDSAIVIDINVLINGTKVHDFNGGVITVSIPYAPSEGENPMDLVVWYLADDGTLSPMTGAYDAEKGAFVFTTAHLSTYVLGRFPFTDVSPDSYFYNAVVWAVNSGVTDGKTDTTFAPYVTCTRAEAVTFLWRAMGSPEPNTTVCPFTDVDESAYYYKAVLWTAEKGITKGSTPTTFSPYATCTRGQVVTLQYRTAVSPAVTTANPFTDVGSGTYYTDAVLWAVKEGITEGTTTTTFSPANFCTRAQIVTFLWRQLGK